MSLFINIQCQEHQCRKLELVHLVEWKMQSLSHWMVTILTSFTVVVIKHRPKINLEKIVTIYNWEKSDRISSRNHGGALLTENYLHEHCLMLCYLSRISHDLLPRDGATPHGLNPPTSIINQKYLSLQVWLQQFDLSYSPHELPPYQVTLGYIKLTTETRHHS